VRSQTIRRDRFSFTSITSRAQNTSASSGENGPVR
jgi:hypothetical protein